MFPVINAERPKRLTHYTLSHESINDMVSKVENCESSVFPDQNLSLVRERLFGSRSPNLYFNLPTKPNLLTKSVVCQTNRIL